MRKLSKDELQYVLNQHELWLITGGEQGKQADLQEADLRNTDLRGCDFHGTYMTCVNLRNANLEGANLRGSYLDRADLRGAKIDHSILKCETLEGTKWLKTDIPWFIQHPDYAEWADTIEILVA